MVAQDAGGVSAQARDAWLNAAAVSVPAFASYSELVTDQQLKMKAVWRGYEK